MTLKLPIIFSFISIVGCQHCGEIAKTDKPTVAPSTAEETKNQTVGSKNTPEVATNDGSEMTKSTVPGSNIYHISGSCTWIRPNKIKDHCSEFGFLSTPTKNKIIELQTKNCISASGIIAEWSDAPCQHRGAYGGCETSKFTSVSDIRTTWEYDEFVASNRKESCFTVWQGRWLDP